MKSSLRIKIDKIKKIFDIEEVVSLRPDLNSIREYYRINKIPYSLFHTKTDLIYMGISRDGKFKKDDLLEAARTVGEYVGKTSAHALLELATGRGANSLYLAKKFPDVRFDGIDISEAQLQFAHKKAAVVKNYHPVLGDYHDLSRYRDGTFDIVFVVEALCYSTAKERVLAEVGRVLKKDGLLIVIDGYLKKERGALSDDEKLACTLIEKSMALMEFESYRSFIKKAQDSSFQIVFEEDLSRFVLPTMRRFEKIAAVSFFITPLARVARKLFPDQFSFNAIAGYLMPTAVESGIFSYMITVLQNKV